MNLKKTRLASAAALAATMMATAMPATAVDFDGYFRAGPGATSKNASRACYKLSGSGVSGAGTVTVKGSGRGGRNTEFALALALALQGQAGIHALSAGTDGLDGNGAAAGAWIGPDTLSRGRSVGIDPLQCLQDNDSFRYFDAIGATVVTGPTFTNINDFRAVLIEPAAV